MLAIRTTIQMALAWVTGGGLLDIVSVRRHGSYLTRHRLSTIVRRIRLVAIAFSIFTLLWIPLDIAALGPDQWQLMAVFRVVASIVFLLLAIAPDWEQSRARSLAMLGIALLMPMMIYGASQYLLAGAELMGLSAFSGVLYRSLPFVVLAGLSIFPLVAVEGLLFAAMIAAGFTAIQLFVVGLHATDLLSNLWVLFLTMGVYLLACAIQLNDMMSLLKRASHDPLTGAMTRRSGVEVLDLQFKLACDQDTPLCVLFVDADNFKSINDNYGHDAGDQALKDIVAKLQAVTRQADVVIRWGGEEFVVVLTNTPMSGALHVVDRIMGQWLGTDAGGRLITASMGLAERQTDAASDWLQLITLADERMFAAKKSGKACCVTHQGVMRA
jgi:diguanylate cyclase (GGDEF)-like protein